MLIDLSHPIEQGMPVYPGDESVYLEKCRALDTDHYNAYSWHTGLHAGTHLDAPMHLLEEGCSMDHMPLERFFAKGILLKNGRDIPKEGIPEGSAVLIDLGAERLYGSSAYYVDYPKVDEALCDYLIERKAALVGVNAPSPDDPPFPIHKKLLKAGIPILENVMNLSRLEGKRFMVIALPMKIRAEGSPVRAAAWIQEE